jgi:hypothetical protein
MSQVPSSNKSHTSNLWIRLYISVVQHQPQCLNIVSVGQAFNESGYMSTGLFLVTSLHRAQSSRCTVRDSTGRLRC